MLTNPNKEKWARCDNKQANGGWERCLVSQEAVKLIKRRKKVLCCLQLGGSIPLKWRIKFSWLHILLSADLRDKEEERIAWSGEPFDAIHASSTIINTERKRCRSYLVARFFVFFWCFLFSPEIVFASENRQSALGNWGLSKVKRSADNPIYRHSLYAIYSQVH